MNLRCIFLLSLLLFVSSAYSDPSPVTLTPLSYLRTCRSLFRRSLIVPFVSNKSVYATAKVSWFSSLIDLGGVFYLSEKQQRDHEIEYDPSSGLWRFVKTGEAPGYRKYEYVMLPDGRIVIGHYHHSALAGGKEIAAGGHFRFSEEGKLIYVSTQTGHYWENFPNSDLNWQQFVKEWIRHGGNPEGTEIYRQQSPDNNDFIQLTSEDVAEISSGVWSKPHNPKK